MLVSEQDFCFKSLNQKFTVKCSWRTARHEKFEPRPKFSGGLWQCLYARKIEAQPQHDPSDKERKKERKNTFPRRSSLPPGWSLNDWYWPGFFQKSSSKFFCSGIYEERLSSEGTQRAEICLQKELRIMSLPEKESLSQWFRPPGPREGPRGESWISKSITVTPW